MDKWRTVDVSVLDVGDKCVWLGFDGGVAAEYGDYTEDEFGPSSVYLRQLRLLPQQTEDIELKIMEHHKDHL